MWCAKPLAVSTCGVCMALAVVACSGEDANETSSSGSPATTSGGATSGTGGDGGDNVGTGGDGGAGTGASGGAGGTGTGGAGTGGAGTGGAGGAGDSVTDDFERATLGGDWAIIFPPPPNDTQVQIFDNSDLGMGPGPQGFFLVNWRGTTLDADQFSEATIPLDVNVDWIHQVYVRWRSSDGARYGFGYAGDPGQGVFGNWIFKYDGVPGPQTRVFAQTPADVVTPPVAGDTLRVEVVGYELRGYKNGMLVLTATDTDPSKIADGEPGLAARWATGNQQTNADSKVWESWTGGSL